jgi:type II secretory pathway pseudopilin PulG
MKGTAGYSLIELLVAMGLTASVMAGVLSVVKLSQDAFFRQGEAADAQQRLRVAADSLMKDVIVAGAGADIGSMVGPLGSYFAPVLPYRRGLVRDDPAGTYRTDTISVLYVPATAAQTTLGGAMTSRATAASLDVGAGCPVGQAACGFKKGDTVLIYDEIGNFDTFTVGTVSATSMAIAQNKPAGAAATTYRAGSKVVRVIDQTYALKTDEANGIHEIVSYDGSANADAPVVDGIVGLTFEYYGDPKPPMLPRPPGIDVQTTAYPPGENCVFQLDPVTHARVPRLGVLGGGSGLVLLSPAQLTDGPWCPDAASANRYDADLLRIRKIGVTLRLSNDQEAHLELSPPNLDAAH